MIFEYLNNSLYFKSYERFLEKKTLKFHGTKIAQNKMNKDRYKHFLGRVSRIKYQVLPKKFDVKMCR